jgi:hypothetical protein
MNIIIHLLKIPLYLYNILDYVVVKILYQVKKCTIEDKEDVNKILEVLIDNIELHQELLIYIELHQNIFTKNKVYTAGFFHDDNDVLFQKNGDQYSLHYKRDIIKFDEKNKFMLKSEWLRLTSESFRA